MKFQKLNYYMFMFIFLCNRIFNYAFKRHIYFVIFISAICINNSEQLIAQISSGGIPVSFSDTTCLPQSNIYSINLPFIDNDSLLQADSIAQLNDSIDRFHFAISISIDYGLTNSGTWETLSDSSRLWRININSVGAYSNFLVFDKFFIPKGAKLFAYNVDRNQVLGAFTEKNNKPYGRFSLGPINGESVILEYFEPPNIDI